MIFFWSKQTETETPEDHWEKLIELERECGFLELSTEFLISKYKTSIANRKLRVKLLKEKEIVAPKMLEQIQQSTYDRKNKKNSLPETPKTNREKEIKEKPTQKIVNTGKDRKSDQRNESADIAMHQTATVIINGQTENHYVITHNCKRRHFEKVCRSEHLKQRDFTKKRSPTRPKIPTKGDTDMSMSKVTGKNT